MTGQLARPRSPSRLLPTRGTATSLTSTLRLHCLRALCFTHARPSRRPVLSLPRPALLPCPVSPLPWLRLHFSLPPPPSPSCPSPSAPLARSSLVCLLRLPPGLRPCLPSLRRAFSSPSPAPSPLLAGSWLPCLSLRGPALCTCRWRRVTLKILLVQSLRGDSRSLVVWII